MSKRMVKNAWERSYRCIKVFKSNCSPFSVNCERSHGPIWVLLLDRVLLLAAAAGIARFLRWCVCVCVFSTACQQKGGSAGAYSGSTNQPGQPRDLGLTFIQVYRRSCLYPHERSFENVTRSFCRRRLPRDAPQCTPDNYQAGKAQKATTRIRKRLVRGAPRKRSNVSTLLYVILFVCEIIPYAYSFIH